MCAAKEQGNCRELKKTDIPSEESAVPTGGLLFAKVPKPKPSKTKRTFDGFGYFLRSKCQPILAKRPKSQDVIPD